MTKPAALEGVRILDFSIWMFGPVATQVLGDFGADVIKVEPPAGEPGRGIGKGHPEINGVSARYLSRNRNKRSIAIDLRTDEGKRIARELARGADVVVHNFRPGVAERLGLSEEELRRDHPDLIYVAGSGYGPDGPYRDLGGQDRAAQAMSGFQRSNGAPGSVPWPARTSIMDVFGGMLMTQAILVALVARRTHRIGQRVDLSLLDAAIAANIEAVTTYLNTGDLVGQRWDPLMGTYTTADGFLQLSMVFSKSDEPLALLCGVLGIDDLASDPRFATEELRIRHGEILSAILDDAFRIEPTDHWLQRLRAVDVIAAPVYDFAQVFDDEQVRHNDLVREVIHPTTGAVRLLDQPIRLSGTPAGIQRSAPTVGEHTDEILGEAGYDAEQVAALRRAGVVR